MKAKTRMKTRATETIEMEKKTNEDNNRDNKDKGNRDDEDNSCFNGNYVNIYFGHKNYRNVDDGYLDGGNKTFSHIKTEFSYFPSLHASTTCIC